MTSFLYKARNSQGVLASGTVEAENAKIVAKQLIMRGFTPVSINPIKPQGLSTSIDNWLASLQKVKTTEIIVFTRQLASILEAGVPLVDGLTALYEQIRHPVFRDVIMTVKKDIEDGSSFSDALERHKKIFSGFVVSMVRAGERAGILDDVLETVSNLLEKDMETVNKIKAATRYPIIVMVTLGLAFVILTTFVIPRFASFFESFKVELPLPTRILIWINTFIQGFGYWVLGGLAALLFGFRKLLQTEKGRYNWDKFMLATPIFGSLFTKIHLSRFARMLAAMIKSGIPILDSLTITAATVENKIISEVILKIREEVAAGRSLSEPMKSSKVFPPIIISMVAIGEKAGTLEKMLNKVADYFDRESEYTIDNLTPLLEPILIFGLAFIMLVFALGIFLPMWDLIKVYKSF